MRIYSIIVGLLTFCTTLLAQQPQIERHRTRLHCKHNGIKRCITYDIYSNQIPNNFDGYKIAFVADTHYKSLFKEKHLTSLSNVLTETATNVVILGGDYQEGCEFVDPLFDAITQYKASDGIYGVMGNNDYERCTDIIKESMKQHNINLLENSIDTIWHNGEYIVLAGAQNTFTKRETIPSPTLQQNPSDFVVLITHTPDYVEDVDISNTDLALAGHTHGGQVTFFGIYAPATNSHYNQQFVKKLRYNSAGIPIIITNGIGTSRKNIRFFAPSEIIVVTLHHKNSQNDTF